VKIILTALLLVACAWSSHAQERVIQKASQADVTGGTNDTRYITPLKLAGAVGGGALNGNALTNNETRAVTLSSNLTVNGASLGVGGGSFMLFGAKTNLLISPFFEGSIFRADGVPIMSVMPGGVVIGTNLLAAHYIGEGSGLTNLDASNLNAGTVALARGGTGASLSDPNADRFFFWDDSAGAADWLTAGSGLSISGTTLSVTGMGTGSTNIVNDGSTVSVTDTNGVPMLSGGLLPLLGVANALSLQVGSNVVALAHNGGRLQFWNPTNSPRSTLVLGEGHLTLLHDNEYISLTNGQTVVGTASGINFSARSTSTAVNYANSVTGVELDSLGIQLFTESGLVVFDATDTTDTTTVKSPDNTSAIEFGPSGSMILTGTPTGDGRGLTNINASKLFWNTNSATSGDTVNLLLPYAAFSTNNNVSYAGLINKDPGGTNFQSSTVFITNSSGATKTVAMNAAFQNMNASEGNTLYLTNFGQLLVFLYPGFGTNFYWKSR
jgi:hypothetical protein